MSQQYITSFIKFFGGSLVLLLVFFLLLSLTVPQFAPSPLMFASVALFFFVISWSSYLYLTNAKKKDSNSFVRSFIGTIALKFVLYLVTLLFLVFVLQNLEVAVILSFLSAFMVYTSIETYYLYKFLKK
ncbi:MAG TPA: hypothetical protein EYM84_05145 [Flavobacteriales bacterium]|nr:hypothetical protein [Flavobacteriales bacterium]HIN39639.1 hypothetical protein [Flavobacteriales bacterium]